MRSPSWRKGRWVVIAPPSYAPGIENVTTWYDEALNVNAGTFSPHLTKNVPSFTHDIYPILKRSVLISWVVEQSSRHHGRLGQFPQSRPSPQAGG